MRRHIITNDPHNQNHPRVVVVVIFVGVVVHYLFTNRHQGFVAVQEAALDAMALIADQRIGCLELSDSGVLFRRDVVCEWCVPQVSCLLLFGPGPWVLECLSADLP